jgi:hypothetical protein
MSETHETANADMQQAIPGLVADIVSGGAEVTRSFSRKIASERQFFVKKIE